MGYNAYGSGLIRFKTDFGPAEMNELREYLDSCGEGFASEYTVKDLFEDDDTVKDIYCPILDMEHDRDYFYEDGVVSVLDHIAAVYGSRGLIHSGEYCFEGEEDLKWRYRYEPKSNTWITEDGRVTFLRDDDIRFIHKALKEWAETHPDEMDTAEQTLLRLE